MISRVIEVNQFGQVCLEAKFGNKKKCLKYLLLPEIDHEMAGNLPYFRL